jgi:hypothetical protein
MRKYFMLIAAIVVSLPALAQAAEAEPPSALVRAIIRVESGGNPFAVFVGGFTHYPDTKEEALRLIAKAVESGKNFDVGLMQINSWWMRRYGIPPESLLDPAVNMMWGSRILAGEISRHGLTWKAVGKYHSPDTERGRLYAWKIYRHYADMAGDREADNGKAEHGHKDLSGTGGIQRHSGVQPQGRVVTFDVQQKGMPGDSGSEPGTPGGPDGTAKD